MSIAIFLALRDDWKGSQLASATQYTYLCYLYEQSERVTDFWWPVWTLGMFGKEWIAYWDNHPCHSLIKYRFKVLVAKQLHMLSIAICSWKCTSKTPISCQSTSILSVQFKCVVNISHCWSKNKSAPHQTKQLSISQTEQYIWPDMLWNSIFIAKFTSWVARIFSCASHSKKKAKMSMKSACKREKVQKVPVKEKKSTEYLQSTNAKNCVSLKLSISKTDGMPG